MYKHWFRYWLAVEQATSHYLNQCLCNGYLHALKDDLSIKTGSQFFCRLWTGLHRWEWTTYKPELSRSLSSFPRVCVAHHSSAWQFSGLYHSRPGHGATKPMSIWQVRGKLNKFIVIFLLFDPWDMQMKFIDFSSWFSDCWLRHLLWNLQVNVTGPHRW